METEPVNFDSLAIGSRFIIGGEIFKKVSPLISQSEETGQLLFDARLFPQWKHVDSPMVEWVLKCESEDTETGENDCPDGLLPDGNICPRCGKRRGPSGIAGGTWVHF